MRGVLRGSVLGVEAGVAPGSLLTTPTDPSAVVTGTVWDYHSLHLKIAGGMAVVASGKNIRTLLDETLAEVGGSCGAVDWRMPCVDSHNTHTLPYKPTSWA